MAVLYLASDWALSSARLDCYWITGHSFRIGAAITAKACGIDNSTIKELRQWKSKAFEAYIKLAERHLAHCSKQLAF